MQALPVVVAQPAVLKQCSDAALTRQECADTVGALVAEVDDCVEGGTDGDLGGRLRQFPDQRLQKTVIVMSGSYKAGLSIWPY